MAYPSLSELLSAYQLQNQGAGPVFQAAQQGLTQGANLASISAQRQALDEYRKASLAQRINEALGKQQQGQEKIDIEKTKSTQGKWKTVGQNPQGNLIQENSETGEQRISPIQAAPGMGKGLNNYADVRLKKDLSSQLLSDPNYRKNQDIIDRGLRIENITSKKDIVDNPAALHILNDLIVAQAEGGKASMAGVTKVANETAPQFASRVLEKIVNEPVSSKADAFIQQLKNISNQDVKSAYTSIDALARAKGNGLKRIYPGHEKDIDSVANNFAGDYVQGIFGGKKPEFLTGGGAKGQVEAPVTEEPTSSPSKSTNSLIDQFNKL